MRVEEKTKRSEENGAEWRSIRNSFEETRKEKITMNIEIED